MDFKSFPPWSIRIEDHESHKAALERWRCFFIEIKNFSTSGFIFENQIILQYPLLKTDLTMINAG